MALLCRTTELMRARLGRCRSRFGNLTLTNRGPGFRTRLEPAVASGALSSRLARACFPPAGLVVLALTLASSIVGAAVRPGPPTQLLPDLDQEFPTQLPVILAGTLCAELSAWSCRPSEHRRRAAVIPASRSLVADDDRRPADRPNGRIAHRRPAIGSLRCTAEPQSLALPRLRPVRASAAGSPKARARRQDRLCLETAIPHTGATRTWFAGPCTPALRLERHEPDCHRGGISVGWGDDYPAFIEFQDLRSTACLPASTCSHQVNADRSCAIRRTQTTPHPSCSIAGAARFRTCACSTCVPTAAMRRRCGRFRHEARRAHLPVHPKRHRRHDGTRRAALQWNSLDRNGVDAPRAWANLTPTAHPAAPV